MAQKDQTTISKAIVVFLLFIIAIFLAHMVTVFFSKNFQFNRTKWPYKDRTTISKAIVVFLLFCLLLIIGISSQVGSVLIVFLAVPQIIRCEGGRQLRIILGPCTPILAFNSINQECSVWTVTLATTAFLAFGVLRPDNSEVLDLLPNWLVAPFGLDAYGERKKWHGWLAFVNTFIAFIHGIVCPCL